jgi:hypothetical protein
LHAASHPPPEFSSMLLIIIQQSPVGIRPIAFKVKQAADQPPVLLSLFPIPFPNPNQEVPFMD